MLLIQVFGKLYKITAVKKVFGVELAFFIIVEMKGVVYMG
jgi:hypothetical protein